MDDHIVEALLEYLGRSGYAIASFSGMIQGEKSNLTNFSIV